MNNEIDGALQRLAAKGVAHNLLAELESNAKALEELHEQTTLGHKPSLDKRSLETLGDLVDVNSRVSKPRAAGAAQKSALVPLLKKPVRSQWPEADRRALANGLRLFGTDFSMIGATVLKHRSYKEIYKRFQREDKLCPEAVNACLQWHLSNKPKLKTAFGSILHAFHIDVERFDPLTLTRGMSYGRTDGILPLEYYLLNPPEILFENTVKASTQAGQPSVE